MRELGFPFRIEQPAAFGEPPPERVVVVGPERAFGGAHGAQTVEVVPLVGAGLVPDDPAPLVAAVDAFAEDDGSRGVVGEPFDPGRPARLADPARGVVGELPRPDGVVDGGEPAVRPVAVDARPDARDVFFGEAVFRVEAPPEHHGAVDAARDLPSGVVVAEFDFVPDDPQRPRESFPGEPPLTVHTGRCPADEHVAVAQGGGRVERGDRPPDVPRRQPDLAVGVRQQHRRSAGTVDRDQRAVLVVLVARLPAEFVHCGQKFANRWSTVDVQEGPNQRPAV